MPAHVVPLPGEKYGPCSGTCNHPECTEMRKIAETPCKYCKEPIGYNKVFYFLAHGELAHYSCLGQTTTK